MPKGRGKQLAPKASTPGKKAAFIKALTEGDGVCQAARKADTTPNTMYAWRRDDKDFAAAWDDAYQTATEDIFVDEAKRRAVDGVEKPIHFKGIRVDTVQEYSDTLLMMLLKARDPQKYCDKLRAARILKAEQDEAERKAREAQNEQFAFNADVRAELDKLAAAKSANTVH